jgi:hypothetical protein
MLTKICFKCNIRKSLDDFYTHKQMRDGHLNKCKMCSRKDVIENRTKRATYYREYDNQRTHHYKDPDYQEQYHRRYPNKYKAHNALNNAIKNKQLIKNPCEICGRVSRVHAHHADYSKPLEIRWLCPVHHKQWHNLNGEGKNG